MRNILFGLSLCLFLFLGYWLTFGQLGLDPGPQALVQTYFGVSRAVAFWIVMGLFALVCAGMHRTA